MEQDMAMLENGGALGEEDEGGTAALAPSGDLSLDGLRARLRSCGGADSLFPPLDGTAFYQLICKINHSCEPNVIVRYSPPSSSSSPSSLGGGGSLGLRAYLTTLRPIESGEELLQSYIDQSLRKLLNLKPKLKISSFFPLTFLLSL